MDLILINKNFSEIGYVYPSGDFEIGDSDALNDFELTGNYLNFGYGLYSPGTEVGGIIEYAKYKSDDVTTYKGWTWRGLLTQDIIIPPSGSDYRIVSGDANAVLKSLIGNSGLLSAVFEVDESTSGINITSYQFNLYCTYLDGIMDMLEDAGAKLVIRANKSEDDKKVHVVLSAAAVSTENGNYNEDVRLPMVFTDDKMGINHLVCMGTGELQERMRIDLYVDNNGNVSQTQYYTGFDERTKYYDYSNAESETDLIDNGTTQLKSLQSGTNLEISAESVELDIGDIVKGHYQYTDTETKQTIDVTVTAPVNKKIYKFDSDGVSIEYGLKEGS